MPATAEDYLSDLHDRAEEIRDLLREVVDRLDRIERGR